MKNTPLAVREVCSFVWCVLILGTCTYVVFWMGHSGWWYLLAMLFMSAWTCRLCLSPEQIAARAKAEGDE